MPMLKTLAASNMKTSKIKGYLEKVQRSELDRCREELRLFENGETELAPRQVEHIHEYLEAGRRGLAIDVSSDLTIEDWARQMDLTRMAYGHDIPWRDGKKCRTYYHFLLSPALDDDCSLETLRSYTRDWVETNFRSGNKRHEYAIVYHDDNTKGVPHAHIVVNVSNKETGRKLHLDNAEAAALQISAQEIGSRYGLTPLREKMETTVGARTEQPVYLSLAERNLLNAGKDCWKWELRKTIVRTAAISCSFEDFRKHLAEQGCDVTRSQKNGYLTYTYSNGKRVKDSNLGALFYAESLEKLFTKELTVEEDRRYADWELMRFSKGDTPWKEEIRQAVDALAPTVLTVPELQDALAERFGIRLTVNRSGITYEHSSGLKARDKSIGYRYTLEGLAYNALIGDARSAPEPQATACEAFRYATRYLPSPMRLSAAAAESLLTGHLIFQEIADLLDRLGLESADDIQGALDAHRRQLEAEKQELTELRNRVLHLNRLASVQEQAEADRAFLAEAEDESPIAYNEILLRYERRAAYLHEQVGSADARVLRDEAQVEFETRLEPYQAALDQLHRDHAVLESYRMTQGVPFGDVQAVDIEQTLDNEALFAAGRTLSASKIKSFLHLSLVLSGKESQLEKALLEAEGMKANLAELQHVRASIQTVIELREQMPASGALARNPALEATGMKATAARYENAVSNLERAGVSEDEFDAVLEACDAVQVKMRESEAEIGKLERSIAELKAAQEVSEVLADILRSPIAPAAVGGGRTEPEELPLAEARRRRETHAGRLPDHADRELVEGERSM